ncbi:Fpg/Nei family DNA glycosylase [Actinacidiphila sp. bgisy160]|uniref:Fpg/Nei family DNA glycosylase n=1 Tax=Actinacidiphila sp. bgisy160 TaxID=3413796 RepID=UPI003D74179C
MPELPDVEGFRRVLSSYGRGRRIEHVEVADPSVLHGVSAPRLRRALEGRRFGAPRRHGKWLIAPTRDGPVLLIHFGMTGLLLRCAPGRPRHPHDRVLFTLSGGRGLRYRDQRKLQGLRLVAGEEAVADVLAGQGPDALEVDRRRFADLLTRRRGRIKAVLIDQSVVAGLGNLLADEILWRTRTPPTRPAASFDEEECERLRTAMRRVLRSAVEAGCVPARRSWLTGHRDTPDPDCPRCGGRLRRERIAGRTTVWCPVCQPARAPDRRGSPRTASVPDGGMTGRRSRTPASAGRNG